MDKVKNKIWVFGDSFSTQFQNKTIGGWVKRYIEWKGYIPKTFGDMLSEELGLEVIHKGRGGSDNDSIFEAVYCAAPNIQKGDIVIIGWSHVLRFRLVDKAGNFSPIIPNFTSLAKNAFDFISPNTIDEIIVNRNLPMYYTELHNRVLFLNWLFEDMKLIQWTPFYGKETKLYGSQFINIISRETNNEVIDGHYSEIGHRELTDTFIKFINNDNLRNKINSLTYKYKPNLI